MSVATTTRKDNTFTHSGQFVLNRPATSEQTATVIEEATEQSLWQLDGVTYKCIFIVKCTVTETRRAAVTTSRGSTTITIDPSNVRPFNAWDGNKDNLARDNAVVQAQANADNQALGLAQYHAIQRAQQKSRSEAKLLTQQFDSASHENKIMFDQNLPKNEANMRARPDDKDRRPDDFYTLRYYRIDQRNDMR